MNLTTAIGRPATDRARPASDETARRYVVVGARGGQGTTTVATVLALLAAGHRPVRLVSTRPDDVCALTACARPLAVTASTLLCPRLTLGGVAAPVPGHPPAGPGGNGSHDLPVVTVLDLGRLGDPAAEAAMPADGCHTTRWLVLRGPCYLSLRAALDSGWRADGVILLVEPGRALGASDVADVLGVPVVAEVPVEASVARVVDAGLLLARLHSLGAFGVLGHLAPARCRRAPVRLMNRRPGPTRRPRSGPRSPRPNTCSGPHRLRRFRQGGRGRRPGKRR